MAVIRPAEDVFRTVKHQLKEVTRRSIERAASKLPLALRAARLRLADGDPADAERAAADLAKLIGQLPAGATENRRAVWTCARDLARSRGTLGALAETLARAPGDRKSTRLNSSHYALSRMPSSA